MAAEEMPQWRRNNLYMLTEASGKIRPSRKSKTPGVRIRRSAKWDAGMMSPMVLTTKNGQVRRSQKGLFVHWCDVCKKGPYSRREHLNRHKQRHIEPTAKCTVCGKNFKEDYFLQQHLKNQHASRIDPLREKSESSSAIESDQVKIESPSLLCSEGSEPASRTCLSSAEQLVYTTSQSNLPCLACSESDEASSCTKNLKAGIPSPAKSDSTLDNSLTSASGTSPRSNTIMQAQSYISRVKSTPPNEASASFRSVNRSPIPGQVARRNAFHWPFSKCPELSTALLRGLVKDFGFVYGKEWMGDLFAIESRQSGIDQSLFAVTAMWQSKVKRDALLRQRAISVYQEAIRNVRAQLKCSRLSNPLVLVATSMIFAATEAQLDDGLDQTGWISHIRGALAVLHTTDPQIWSASYIGLYIDLRYMALLVFLGVRKPFFMAKEEWKGMIWPRYSKTIREWLIDDLVELPELLCLCTILENKLSVKLTAVCEMDLLKGWHLLGAFRQFEMRLNLWREGLEKHYGFALYWEQPSSNPMPLSSTDEESFAIFFANPLIAESITLYWAGLLLMYISALDIYNLIQFHASIQAAGSKPARSAFPSDFDADEFALWQPGISDARKIANSLGQSLEYINGEAFEPLNGARLACVLLWPAMRFFVRYPGPEGSWLQRVAQEVSEKTGLQYVSKLATSPVDLFRENA